MRFLPLLLVVGSSTLTNVKVASAWKFPEQAAVADDVIFFFV